MGRWKMGPQGGYWDAQDTGPDQFTPPPGTQPPGPPPTAPPMMAEPGGIAGPRPPGTGSLLEPLEASGPGMKIDPTTGHPFDTGTGQPYKPRGMMIGPITLAPGQNGLWDLTQAGGLAQPMQFQALLEALKTRFGSGSALLGQPGGVNGSVGATVSQAASQRQPSTSRGLPQTPSAQPRTLLGGLFGR